MEKKQEFEALAKAALPHLTALCKIARKNNLGDEVYHSISFHYKVGDATYTIGEDGGGGYIDFSTSVYRHWCVSRFPDDGPEIRYNGKPIERLEVK